MTLFDLRREYDAVLVVDMQKVYIDRFSTIHPKRTGIPRTEMITYFSEMLSNQKEMLEHAVSNNKPIYQVNMFGAGTAPEALEDVLAHTSRTFVKGNPGAKEPAKWKDDILNEFTENTYARILTMGIHLDDCLGEVNMLLANRNSGRKVITAKTLVDDPDKFKISSYEKAGLHKITYLDSHKELIS